MKLQCLESEPIAYNGEAAGSSTVVPSASDTQRKTIVQANVQAPEAWNGFPADAGEISSEPSPCDDVEVEFSVHESDDTAPEDSLKTQLGRQYQHHDIDEIMESRMG